MCAMIKQYRCVLIVLACDFWDVWRKQTVSCLHCRRCRDLLGRYMEDMGGAASWFGSFLYSCRIDSTFPHMLSKHLTTACPLAHTHRSLSQETTSEAIMTFYVFLFNKSKRLHTRAHKHTHTHTQARAHAWRKANSWRCCKQPLALLLLTSQVRPIQPKLLKAHKSWLGKDLKESRENRMPRGLWLWQGSLSSLLALLHSQVAQCHLANRGQTFENLRTQILLIRSSLGRLLGLLLWPQLVVPYTNRSK